MIRKQANKPRRQKHQRDQKLMPRAYHNVQKQKSSDMDYIKAQKLWQDRFNKARKKDPELKKAFGESWTWHQIKVYIIKMLRVIKQNL